MKNYFIIIFVILTFTLWSQEIDKGNTKVQKEFYEWLSEASKLKKIYSTGLEPTKQYKVLFSCTSPYSSFDHYQIDLQNDSIMKFINPMFEHTCKSKIVKENKVIGGSELNLFKTGFFYSSLTVFGEKYFIYQGTQIHQHGGQISYGTTFTYYFEEF